MFEVRVEADFAAAHFLKDYHGKCENLHGHNYAVFAHAKGTELDDGGMLLDFGILKTALRNVCKKLDHTNLNDLQENGNLVFKQNPSAERIAKWIFDKTVEEIDIVYAEVKGTTLTCGSNNQDKTSVVNESDNCIARVSETDIAKSPETATISLNDNENDNASSPSSLLYAVDVFETPTSRARYIR